MSEERLRYTVANPLQSPEKPATITVVRAELEEIERRLIPLLVMVQRALGKQPTITTRAERRAR